MPRRRRHKEENSNHEAWAIPYGDLVTLLLAFFVMMYAISSVNASKYEAVSKSLNAAFNGHQQSPQTVQTDEKPPPIEDSLPSREASRIVAAGLPVPERFAAPNSSANPTQGKAPGAASNDSKQEEQARIEQAAALSNRLQRISSEIQTAMKNLVPDGTVTVLRRGDSLEIRISTDILFTSGEAQLSGRAMPALQALAESLKQWPNSLLVEGHTDDRPIHTALYPSNWELSAARAASLVHLFADSGVAPQRMSIVGMGEYSPLQPNDTAAGRNANRRVTVTVLGRGESSGASSPLSRGAKP